EFEQAGFKVTPVSTAYTTRYKTDLLAFIPTAEALLKSRLFLHEIIGMLWYWLTPAPSQP
ncbi:MAG: YdcF family protein, partial [Nitrosomonadaceae bacterium]